MKMANICAAIISTVLASTVHAEIYSSRTADGVLVFSNIHDSRLNQKKVAADPPKSNTNGHSPQNSYQEFMKRVNAGFDRNVNSAADAMTCGEAGLATELKFATMDYYDHNFDATSSQRQILREKFERDSQTLYSLATANQKVKWPEDLCAKALERAKKNLQQTRDRRW